MSWIIFYLASTERGSDMKRKVDWDDEENEQSSMELSEETSETEASDEEDSSEEEPRIKDVLENLSQTVSRKRASDLLHSMAASKDILFWTPRRQLLQNKRIIPVTNIAELVEYILLPHNDDVTKPRALNTFLDGLAELGVDKRLIKNKKILSELLEKEKAYRENKTRLMMTATVTTVTTAVTKRKLLRNKVNPKALMGKVTVSPTTNTSFKKNPRNPVIIVKIGMRLHLRWLNVQAAFGTITIVFVPFVVTKSPLMPNM